MEVVLVPWPSGTAFGAYLARKRRPRLLVIEAGTFPPFVDDPLEDWVRVSSPVTGVKTQIDALARRAFLRSEAPTLVDDGVIRHKDLWVSLPPVGARMARPLVERFGSVVSRPSLSSGAWPEGAPARNALDVHLRRLRGRLGQVGEALRTVRARGVVLEEAEPGLADDS